MAGSLSIFLLITRKPFSTISYNSKEHLIRVLDKLKDDRKISFYFLIWHRPEEDEKKGHFHLYVVPAINRFDTFQFERELDEMVQGEDLPRRCLPCQSSKFQDAYLYFLHDSAYLYSKGQSRKYHYREKDIITSDRDHLLELSHQIDWTKINPLGTIINAARNGISFSEFLESFPLPILQVRSAEFVFKQIQGGETTFRNDRFTHEPGDKVDNSPWRDKSKD